MDESGVFMFELLEYAIANNILILTVSENFLQHERTVTPRRRVISPPIDYPNRYLLERVG